MNIFHLLLAAGIALLLCPGADAQDIPLRGFKEIRLGAAVCRASDSGLVVNTGKMERIYRLSPRGLYTAGLRLPGGKLSETKEEDGEADWDMGLDEKADLKGITAEIADDSGFTAKHIRISCEFEYLLAGVRLRYIIWVYPGSGIRTQLEWRTLARDGTDGHADSRTVKSAGWAVDRQRVEYIPVSPEKAAITAFGYYNDTQHRDTDTTPILKEERISPGARTDWASGLLVSYKTNGLVLVKESHKCVNQAGVATGGWETGPGGVAITGAGLAADRDPGPYKKCWATWIVPYAGDSTDALLALKEFDRLRYPVRESDRYIMANTWGNSDTSPEGQGQYAAREENVLREIASQAGLGIDVQQIDDGWQGREYKQWRPAAGATMLSTVKGVPGKPYAIYPAGWSKVKEYATRKNVKLGLWAAWNIPEEDLRWNYDNGGFRYVKLDFAVLDTREKLDRFMAKVRSFVVYTHNTVRINWDVTENAPRVGYFYAREFGNVWLENRKPSVPVNVIYKPRLVLRDEWQLAKYMNLNQFQVAIQNVDPVNRSLSNAYLYSNTYCAAIALPSSPMFFSLTQFYSADDRARTKELITAYKRDRDELFKGYVFPIGELPNDSTWTGFQDVVPGSGTGWLLIFRELRNERASQAIRLEYIRNRNIEVTDLLTGETENIFVDKAGLATFRIAKPAGFRFYRYRIRP